jgi:hypothetical protein
MIVVGQTQGEHVGEGGQERGVVHGHFEQEGYQFLAFLILIDSFVSLSNQVKVALKEVSEPVSLRLSQNVREYGIKECLLLQHGFDLRVVCEL